MTNDAPNINFQTAVFDDPKNAIAGCGRVIFAKATVTMSGEKHPDGWVLPGGRRTDNEREAQAAALAIHGFCNATQPRALG